jgi:lysyl endopeptidase
MQKIRWLAMLACLGLLLIPAMPAGAAPQPSAASPPAGLAQGALPLSQVQSITMPAVNVAQLLAEDEHRAEAGLPPRFAYPMKVQIEPVTSGTWEKLDNSTLLWRMRIAASGAVSLNLGFTRYLMPLGGKLYLYSSDYSSVYGPFTDKDNESHGQLWTPIVLGDEIVIELQLPASKRSDLQLELTYVNYGYTGFGTAGWLLSGSCNLDVVCSAADGFPQVDAWRDQIRAVGVISTGGSTFCTGFMVNNTAQDLTPYFMTANHCSINSSNAASLVVYWNYENSWCRPPGSAASGGSGDGTLSQYQTGSIFRASYSASDFTLVQLDDDPDPAWNLYWAGWDHTSADATSAVGIHHPNTDEKRISFENDPTSTTSYLGTSVPGDGTHVRITDWDLGTTEPGSSGSPLFNQDHRVIGQLHGGYAACGNDSSDWYGRFSVSWNGGGSSANRLSDWLDPLHSGVPFLDGRGLANTPFALEVMPAAMDVCAPADATFGIAVTRLIDTFVDAVTLTTQGQPAGTTVGFTTNPVVPPGTSIMTIGDTGSALSGSYNIDVVGTASTATATATVGLNLYTSLLNQTTLVSPADGATDQPLQPVLTWDSLPEISSYNLELDLNPLFGSPLISATAIPETSYTPASPLEDGRCYWWRVQGDNPCGVGPWTEPFHLATAHLATSFYDDVEADGGNWSHGASSGTDHWQVSTNQAHSPTHAWFVPDDHVVTDSQLWNTMPLAIGGGSTLTFWHRYQFEGTTYDGAVLEISANGGPWTDLRPYIAAPNSYNGTISTSFDNPLGGRQAWTGDLTDWTRVVVNLDSFASQTVQIRWRIGCDSSIGDVGWYIDDVEITTPLPPNPAPALLSITPNIGSTFGDTPVQIEGSDFIETPSVKLGDTWLPSITQISSTTLAALVPAGMAGGTYDLTLYNGDCQEASLLAAYTVIIECISPTVALTSDSPVELGQPMHLTADLLIGTLPVTYTWDFGGPGSGSGLDTATPVFAYTNYSDYVVELTVDDQCGSVVVTEPVSVECTPPTVTLTSDSPVVLGQPMHLTANLLTGTLPMTYTWNLGGPGSGSGLTTATPVFTYTAPGDYAVELTVDGPCGSATVTEPVSVEPVRHFIYLPLVVRNTAP